VAPFTSVALEASEGKSNMLIISSTLSGETFSIFMAESRKVSCPPSPVNSDGIIL